MGRAVGPWMAAYPSPMARYGNLGFYEAAAQVIPLAFIALAIEMRAFQRRLEEHESPLLFALGGCFLIVLMVASEGAALAALHAGEARKWHEALVVAGLTMGVGSVPIIFMAVLFIQVPGRLDASWSGRFQSCGAC